MTQLYWQVYKNLEQEFLALADVIFINDEQQGVYSMKIADLLIRTAVEIEALAKELYLASGGDTTVPDEEMYFDTVCIAHLDDIWKLNSKKVIVISPNVYLANDDNRIISPLHKARKRGSSSADWNKAYQAVKHNRVKELKKGSVKHLLRALAALYVLNLYYKNETIENLTDTENKQVDTSFGSNLFAVYLHPCNGLKEDGTYEKQANYDECVYIVDYEDGSKLKAVEALKEFNDFIRKSSVETIMAQANQLLEKGEKVTAEWIESKKSEAFSQAIHSVDYHLSRKFNAGINGMRFNVVLNKQQY